MILNWHAYLKYIGFDDLPSAFHYQVCQKTKSFPLHHSQEVIFV